MENKYSIGLILDRSGSVIYEKKMLEDSIKLIIEALKKKYSNIAEKEILLSYIGGEEISLPQLNSSVNLNVMKSILELVEKLKSTKGLRKVILFSDGYMDSENWEEIILKSSEIEEIERISVGIGEGSFNAELKRFSSKEETYSYRDVYDLI